MEKSKLGIEKFTVAKLENLHTINGGSELNAVLADAQTDKGIRNSSLPCLFDKK